MDKLCNLVTPQSVSQFGVNECHFAKSLNASTNGGRDAIDIKKVEKHTNSQRPPNIYIANECFQKPG